MDRLFDRLGDLLQSLLGGGGTAGRASAGPDPDLQEAWAELEEYLRTGSTPPRGSVRRPGGRPHNPGERPRGPGSAPPRSTPRPDESLRRDYELLQVPFGSPFPEVKRGYKRLLQRYHPDRFAGETDKQRSAEEITRAVIAAYRRIRQAVEKSGNR